MKRDLLTEPVRRRLKRLPAPFENHYGVVPLPPPKEGLDLRDVSRRHHEALGALAKIDVLAAEAHDPYFVSRILTRREALSSSALEGTNSTLDEILALEETADEHSKDAAKQVRELLRDIQNLSATRHKARRFATRAANRRIPT